MKLRIGRTMQCAPWHCVDPRNDQRIAFGHTPCDAFANWRERFGTVADKFYSRGVRPVVFAEEAARAMAAAQEEVRKATESFRIRRDEAIRREMQRKQAHAIIDVFYDEMQTAYHAYPKHYSKALRLEVKKLVARFAPLVHDRLPEAMRRAVKGVSTR